MKNFKRIFGFVLVALVSVFGAFMFSACDSNPMGGRFEAVEAVDVLDQLRAYRNDLNKTNSSGNLLGLNHKFIKVGTTTGIDEIQSVRVGAMTFRDDSRVKMSGIGSSSTYKPFIWDSDTGELSISAIVLLLEGGDNITVNGNRASFQLSTDEIKGITALSLPNLVDATKNRITQQDSTHYTVTSSDRSQYAVVAQIPEVSTSKSRCIMRITSGDGKLVEYRSATITGGRLELELNFVEQNSASAVAEGVKGFKIMTMNNVYYVIITSLNGSFAATFRPRAVVTSKTLDRDLC